LNQQIECLEQTAININNGTQSELIGLSLETFKSIPIDEHIFVDTFVDQNQQLLPINNHPFFMQQSIFELPDYSFWTNAPNIDYLKTQLEFGHLEDLFNTNSIIVSNGDHSTKITSRIFQTSTPVIPTSLNLEQNSNALSPVSSSSPSSNKNSKEKRYCPKKLLKNRKKVLITMPY